MRERYQREIFMHEFKDDSHVANNLRVQLEEKASIKN